jgi:hypothetical protein
MHLRQSSGQQQATADQNAYRDMTLKGQRVPIQGHREKS